jgi:uncharacterized protein with predicted RNA binding PUA domain
MGGMGGDLGRIRGIADYQFGRGCGGALFPPDVAITYSKNTGRIRHIHLDGALLATLRPTDGLFTLTIRGAERLISNVEFPGLTVTVTDEAAEFAAMGRNVFAKHVVDAGDNIRPGTEVIILDRRGGVLAVGRALLTRREMLSFGVGVAVKVRRGRDRDR